MDSDVAIVMAVVTAALVSRGEAWGVHGLPDSRPGLAATWGLVTVKAKGQHASQASRWTPGPAGLPGAQGFTVGALGILYRAPMDPQTTQHQRKRYGSHSVLEGTRLHEDQAATSVRDGVSRGPSHCVSF